MVNASKKIGLVLILIISMTSNVFAVKKYFAKFMPQDYSNWVWQEIPNVASCVKTSDGFQYIIKYRGVPEPRVIYGSNKYANEKMKERDLTMTIGVDNVLIYEYSE